MQNQVIPNVSTDFISVTLIEDNIPETYTFIKDHNPRKYYKAYDALMDRDYDAIKDLHADVESHLKELDPDVKIEDDQLYYKGYVVDNFVTRKIKELHAEGKVVSHWIQFLKRAMNNPHGHTVQELYRFLENHEGCPITTDGGFLAYKKVNHDFKSFFAGSNGKREDWTPGSTPELDRSACDGDRQHACSSGLHFCSRDYLPSFYGNSGKVVMVKVFPEDVVAIPIDHNEAKGRCCKAHSLKEIPDLAGFAFGYYYNEEGDEIDDEHISQAMSQKSFERLESQLRFFFRHSPDADDEISIIEFVDLVDEFLVEEGDYSFVGDVEDVLYVLNNSNDDVLEDVDLEEQSDILVCYRG